MGKFESLGHFFVCVCVCESLEFGQQRQQQQEEVIAVSLLIASTPV
jgi:hypothetical protein